MRYAAKPRIEVDGEPLPDSIDLRLERAVVEDHLFLPDMFELRFRDPDRDLIADLAIRIGASLRILAAPLGGDASEPLVTGEVTALELDVDMTGSHTIVRGYDHSHRLHRGRRTEAYRNVTEADLARQVARSVGLETGQIDDAGGPIRYVSRANLTDWEFLQTRSNGIGYDFGVADGKLQFKGPAAASDGPATGDLASTDPLQLVLGKDLLSFHSRITSAQQVTKVEVRGWDPDEQEPVIGSADAETSSASLGDYSPADLASTFGDPVHVIAGRAFSTQAEVDSAAHASAGHLAGAFAEADGVARGDPGIRAGVPVSIGLTGQPFEGSYTITTSRHVFDVDGYRTFFSSSGREERSLLGLASLGATNGSFDPAGPPIEGLVVGQVTSVADPDGLARVKVSFPWLSDTYESDWARLVQAGAGNERGMVVLPEVNDEVIVAFDHGDIRRPYVLGGVYSKKNPPDEGEGLIDDGTGAVLRRGFVSRQGHALVFFDDDGDTGIALLSAGRGLRLSMNESDTVIKISSDGAVAIEASGTVSIKGRDIDLSAESGVSIDGGSGNVKVTGTQIQLN
jgi:phage protein D